jgi:hypothetical protein
MLIKSLYHLAFLVRCYCLRRVSFAEASVSSDMLGWLRLYDLIVLFGRSYIFEARKLRLTDTALVLAPRWLSSLDMRYIKPPWMHEYSVVSR